jgi:FtsP/CotA-like multicopper oxidase with cupredoxin domain
MYHCHFEDTEHVHMGMTGPVFVRPIQNKGSASTGFKAKYPGYSGPTIPAGKYAYNDQDGSTAYDREYVIFLSEVWNQSHWDDAHIQLPDWTDYKADFYLMNGRVYPDTLLPNATLVGNNPKAAIDTSQPPLVGAPTNGVAGNLSTQPYSSLVQCNANEKVLLRFINLGFTKATMTLSGLRMKVVGMDATLLRGKSDANGHYANGYYETNSLQIGPGESVDAIVTAPAFTGASGDHDSYPLFNRNLAGSSNNGMAGLGGQVTEVRVFNGTRPAQQHPNDL